MSEYSKNLNLIEIICDNCGKLHFKNKYVVNKGKKLNRKFTCSTKCRTDLAFLKNPNYIRNISGLRKDCPDEFTPFRMMWQKAKTRGLTLPIQAIKDQWEKQNGLCPYSNIPLVCRTNYKNLLPNPLFQASIDKIDPKKSYTIDNIEIVPLGLNYLKNVYSKQQVIEFLHSLVEHCGFEPQSLIKQNL